MAHNEYVETCFWVYLLIFPHHVGLSLKGTKWFIMLWKALLSILRELWNIECTYISQWMFLSVKEALSYFIELCCSSIPVPLKDRLTSAFKDSRIKPLTVPRLPFVKRAHYGLKRWSCLLRCERISPGEPTIGLPDISYLQGHRRMNSFHPS